MKSGQDWDSVGPCEPPGEEENFSILKYVNVLLRRRWLIVIGTLGLCILAFVYGRLQTPVYEAGASFLPSRSQDMSSRLDESFGVGRAPTDRNADVQYLIEYYNQVLLSRSFLEKVANKPLPSTEIGGTPKTLLEHTKASGETEVDRLENGLKSIRDRLKVIAPKPTAGRATSTVMGISVSASDPVIAAAAVNLFLDELVVFNQNEMNSKAKSNREFIENQLKETQKLLSEAEKASSDFERTNRKIATPELQVEKDRLKRNVRLQEEISITLNKQLELAKIQEQETKNPLVIIQRAVPPRSRTSPNIRKLVLMAGFLGLMLFCGLALALDFVKKVDTENPEMKELLDTLEDVKGDVRKVGRIFFGLGRKKPPKKK